MNLSKTKRWFYFSVRVEPEGSRGVSWGLALIEVRNSAKVCLNARANSGSRDGTKNTNTTITMTSK